MTPINKRRHTNKFLITSVSVNDLSRILEWTNKNGLDLVSVANDGEVCEYTIRAIANDTLVDIALSVIGSVREVGRTTVVSFGEKAA